MTKNITINWVLNDTPQVCLVFSETEFISSRLSKSKLLIYHFILMFSNFEIYFVGKIRSGRFKIVLFVTKWDNENENEMWFFFDSFNHTWSLGGIFIRRIKNLSISSTKYGIIFMFYCHYKTKHRFGSPQRKGILPNLNAIPHTAPVFMSKNKKMIVEE